MKLLQLNTYHGYTLDAIISYLQQHEFDLIHFQEISKGKKWVNADSLATLQEVLNMESVFERCWKFKNEPESYFGNATFYNNSLKCIKKEVISMEGFREIEELEDNKYQDLPRSALALQLASRDAVFWSINTHMAWGPTPLDAPHKIKQAQILADYVRDLKEPFVLTGDFNVVPSTNVISMFDALGKNLISEHSIENTLNPNMHRVKELFPKGLAVDYIFVGKGVKAENFKVIDSPDLSDHFGLKADITI